ncbi:MAG TPA: hypothetical protein EYQ59_00400 [Planctomycetes bacterium]|nr:hypothetical protein [Planctomycetota bacterium]
MNDRRFDPSHILFLAIIAAWLAGDWALHGGRNISWLGWTSFGALVAAFALGGLRLLRAKDSVQCLARITTTVLLAVPVALLFVALELMVRAEEAEAISVLWLRSSIHIAMVLAIMTLGLGTRKPAQAVGES